jgi:hypothetical protein
MIKWEDYLADKEHYRDLRREAEQEQLSQGSGKKNPLYSRALHWLGDHLVGWGRRLQKH